MVVGAATKLAGKLLGKDLVKRIGGDASLRSIVGQSLGSGAINTAGGLLTGMDPLSALTYGVADTAASAGSLGLVRGLSKSRGKQKIIRTSPDGKKTKTKEPIPSPYELPVNVLASLGTGIGLSALGVGMSPQGVQGAQQSQVLQQQGQRAAVNQDPSLLAGAYLPYTNFQNLGMPSRSALLEQAMNDSGPGFDMAGYEKGMQQILGL